MMEPLIETHRLTKSFGLNRALKDLELAVAPGEIYGLVGPDGAGKTTAIRLLCGALAPDRASGMQPQVMIAGFDMLRQTEQARAQIGYLPQRFSLYEELTVLENIRFFAEVRGIPAAQWRPRCMEILHFVDLDAFTDRKAGELSGGMKQKLGLAAALVHKPRVLLLDEPTTGVDPVTRQDFWQLIIRLAAGRDGHPGGVSVLVSTPYMDEAARCHRVGFLLRGVMRVEGTPEQLRTQWSNRIVELRGQPLPLLRSLAQADLGVEEAHMFGDRIHLHTAPGASAEVIERLLAAIPAAGGELRVIRPVPPSLEDVFIAESARPETPHLAGGYHAG